MRKKITKVVLIILALAIIAGLTAAAMNENVLFTIKWSVGQTYKKIGYSAVNYFHKVSPSDVEIVKNFIALQKEMEELEGVIKQKSAQGLPHQDESSKLAFLYGQQKKIKEETEAVIESQMRQIAMEENLFINKGLRIFFPPPRFVLTSSPNILVLSSRSEMRIIDVKMLEGSLGIEEMENIEKSAEKKDESASALVVKTGGMAALFPTPIEKSSSLRWLLQTAAHEWLHQYLFLASGLGRSYFNNQETRTINETAVSILGKELGDKIYLRFYASETEREQIEKEAFSRKNPKDKPVLPQDEHDFSFNEFMRETYLEASRLLKNGDTKKAEIHMEERRQKLFEYGYFLRKINQAYFAFYGTYADSPSWPDPIGDALQKIWSKAVSVDDFINLIGNVESLEDLEKILNELE